MLPGDPQHQDLQLRSSGPLCDLGEDACVLLLQGWGHMRLAPAQV